MESATSGIDCLSDYAVSLLNCCHCQQLLNEPRLLDCLHACCVSCLMFGNAREPALNSPLGLECPVCREYSDIRGVLMTNSFLRNYQRLFALSLDMVCCIKCDVKDEVTAVYWCVDCFSGLCLSCYSRHNKRNHHHHSAELEVARMWPLSQLMPAGQCDLHKRPITEQCFTCRTPKCLLCCAPCGAAKHEMQPLLHAETTKWISASTRAIFTSKERLLRAVSSLQEKSGHMVSRFKRQLRTDGHKMLVQGHRSLSHSSVSSFDRSVAEVCVNLQRMGQLCTAHLYPLAKIHAAFLAARHTEFLATARLKTLHSYRESGLLKIISYRSMSAVDALLSQRLKYWRENSGFSIDGAVPHTSDVMLRSWLTATYQRQGVPSAPTVFCEDTKRFCITTICWDLAVTREGHVLLAAAEHGLLVYSDRGQKLSRRRAEKRSDGENDSVTCVVALSDRRAVVGVFHAQLVMLLRQSETGDSWQEDRRVAVMQSPLRHLAVHADLLAAAEWRLDEQQQAWVCPGCQVKLLWLSSGNLLYTHSREYDIGRVALTAHCLLTVSWGGVRRNSAVDAFSHSGNFLWRHESSDEERVYGLCASAYTWRCVYVGVKNKDGSSRVMMISGCDGSDMREVLSSRTHGLQIPRHLSLTIGQQRAVLAVLGWDEKTVSLYEASS